MYKMEVEERKWLPHKLLFVNNWKNEVNIVEMWKAVEAEGALFDLLPEKSVSSSGNNS